MPISTLTNIGCACSAPSSKPTWRRTRADAPKILCIGDIHIENFGTWRDAQSRFVWGVNNFDEAPVMSYAYELIRLVTSARLAPASA